MALSDNLEAFWEMEEAVSNPRLDSHGSNDLTEIGGPNPGPDVTTGKVGDAADFTSADTELLTAANNSSLNVGGNQDFTLAGWVNLKTKTGSNQSIMVKLTSSDGEYRLDYRDGGTDRFRFAIYGAAAFADAGGISADTLGSPSTATWYFIVVRHNAAADTISIQVNDGTIDSTGHTFGVYSAGTANLYLGGDNQLVQYGNLLLDQWGFWKRVLTTDEGTFLYNSGNGRSYAEVIADAGADKTTWDFPELTTPVLADLLAVVDDVAGTPITKKLALTHFAGLTVSNVVVQVKTVGSGTYTPTASMKKVLAIAVGGGGGGAGGIIADSAGGGGGGGGTVIRLMTAADIGSSKGYVVGGGGAATSNGTATTLDSGTLMNAGAGQAGTAGAAFSVVGVTVAGGAGGSAANGDLNIPGEPGERGVIFSATTGQGGKGGNSAFGFGGQPGGVDVAGIVGTAYGGGGSGGHAAGNTDRVGQSGADGILYLIEFLG